MDKINYYKTNNNNNDMNIIHNTKNHKLLISWEQESNKNLTQEEKKRKLELINKIDKIAERVNQEVAENNKKNKTNEEKNSEISKERTELEEKIATPSHCVGASSLRETSMKVLDLILKTGPIAFTKGNFSLFPKNLCNCLKYLCSRSEIPLNKSLLEKKSSYKKAGQIYDILKINYKNQELVGVNSYEKMLTNMKILEKDLNKKFEIDLNKEMEINNGKQELEKTCLTILKFIEENEFPKNFFSKKDLMNFRFNACCWMEYLTQYLQIPFPNALSEMRTSKKKVKEIYVFLKKNYKNQELTNVVYSPERLKDMQELESRLLSTKSNSNI